MAKSIKIQTRTKSHKTQDGIKHSFIFFSEDAKGNEIVYAISTKRYASAGNAANACRVLKARILASAE